MSDDEISDDELALHIDKEEILRAVQELTPAYRTVFNLYVIRSGRSKSWPHPSGYKHGRHAAAWCRG